MSSEFKTAKTGGAPALVRLMLTEQCNLRCKYCYAAKRDVYMSPHTAEAALRAIKSAARGRERVDVEITGGEPLLAREILFAVFDGLKRIAAEPELAGKLGGVTVITNATLMDEELAKLFAQAGASLRVSLDGAEETHDSQRAALDGSAGGWARTIKGVELALSAGVDLSVNAVVTPNGARRVEDDFFRAYDAVKRGFVKISPQIGVLWRDSELEALAAGLAEIRALIFACEKYFTNKTWTDELSSALVHCDYAAGLPAGENSAAATIDPAGVIYRDEFEETTRSFLVAGGLGSFKSFDGIDLSGPGSMRLVYERGLRPKEILDSQRAAYGAMREHYEALLARLKPRYGAAAADASSGMTDDEAAFLLTPLKPGRQRIAGFTLASARGEKNGASYVFSSCEGETISVALLPYSNAYEPYALARDYAIVVKCDAPASDISADAKALLEAFRKLIMKNGR